MREEGQAWGSHSIFWHHLLSESCVSCFLQSRSEPGKQEVKQRDGAQGELGQGCLKEGEGPDPYSAGSTPKTHPSPSKSWMLLGSAFPLEDSVICCMCEGMLGALCA